MKKIMSFIIKHSGVFAAIALVVSISSLDSACYIGYHQSEVPEALNVYRR